MTDRPWSRVWMATVVAVGLLGVAVPGAMAEGGKTISAAPVISYGIHETGDTSSGGEGSFHHECEGQFELNLNSFWQLPVTVGDHVTIDWEAVIPDSTCLTVFPIGTNDFGLQTADPEESTEQGSNGKQEMKFTAPASGNLILNFSATKLHSGCTDCAGPYGFTALFQHTLQMTLAAPASVPTNGALTASVTQNTGTPVPDGLVFWLLGSWNEGGEKKTFSGTGTSSGGSISFPLGLPVTAAGHKVTFKAGRAEDGSYIEALSNPITTEAEAPVLAPAPAPPRQHHHRRHHRRHHRHHHHHHHRHRHHRG